jgi:methylmalonyl-CoA mutase
VAPEKIELARSTDAEKQSQLKRVKTFKEEHAQQATELLECLRRTVIDDGNTFEVLMDAVRGLSLGQITHTLYDVGGRYRRNM